MRIRVIILGAEKFRNGLLNVRDLESPLLIPDNGSPIFTQMLFDDQEIETIFVVNEEATLISRLLRNRYLEHQNVKLIAISLNQDGRNGPAISLSLALDQIPQDDIPLLVFFGDNLFNLEEVFSTLSESSISDLSVVGFCFEFVDSPKYSFFMVDNESRMTGYIEKNSSGLDHKNLKTDVGMYFFGNSHDLRQVLAVGECREMSDILNKFKGVGVLHLKEWKDLGHWDLLSNAKQIGSSRSFNSLAFIEETGCLRKSSTNIKKIVNEINFYQNLPEEFAMHFPRLHSSNPLAGQYAIEYWPIKSLSEYIVFWKISSTKLSLVAEKISARLDSYSRHCAPELQSQLLPEKLFLFYSEKFLHSLEESKFLHDGILKKTSIRINGETYLGFPILLPNFLSQLKSFCQSPIPGFLHGDLCFSNILYSPEEGLMKFIDPRGSFMNFLNFGDIRYDVAKLFQGLGGFYDFIKADYYSLSEIEEDHWQLQIFADQEFVKAIPLLEEIILKRIPGLGSFEVYQMVVLNFISLLPFHADNESDQLAFILISILLLNSASTNLLVEILP